MSNNSELTQDSLFESNFSEQPIDQANRTATTATTANTTNTSATAAANTTTTASTTATNMASSPTNTTTSSNPTSHHTTNPSNISDEEFGNTVITLRALVTSKEAGVIIGKGGKNVADLREQTGVKAGVSKPVVGIPERVLTISGILNGVSKAYSMSASTLVDSPPLPPPSSSSHLYSLSAPPPPGISTIRLLISHQQMGSVIGRQGLRIKNIQEKAKVRMVASKEMLPQSTERIVEIQGTPDAISTAIWEVGKCLLEDGERAVGTIPYNPQLVSQTSTNLNNGFRSRFNNRLSSGNFSLYKDNGNNHNNGTNDINNNHNNHNDSSNDRNNNNGEETYQEIAISSDMVGCIIGRGGTKIQEIRRVSGARISIAKQAHDETGDRLFTIRGTPEANEKALFLLYEQLENEKNRRTADEQ